MDIEDPAGLFAHEGGAEDAHESREHDEIGHERIYGFEQGAIEGFAVREVTMFDDCRRHARLRRALQPESRRIVANDSRHSIAAILRLIDERLQIRAVARNQHDDVA